MKETTTKKTQKTSSTKQNTTHGKKPKPSTTQPALNKMLVMLHMAEKVRDMTLQDQEHSFYHRGVMTGACACLCGLLSGVLLQAFMLLFDVSFLPDWGQALYAFGRCLLGVIATYLVSKSLLRRGEEVLQCADKCHEEYQAELDKKINDLKEEE